MSTPLVSAAWLLAHQQDVRILDTRFKLGDPDFGRNSYLAGHIPGAAFVDLERDLHSPVRPDRVGGRHPLPDPAAISAVFSKLGLTNSDHIVAYDDPSTGMGFYAAHLWWLFGYLDHGNVSVLDGGLPAWLAAGGRQERNQPTQTESNFAINVRSGMIVDAGDVQARSSTTAIADSRAGERFRGELEPLDWKAGHIPGAVNKNWADSLTSDGHWKSVPEQEQRFADLRQESEIIVYCGSGVSAGANMLALELAGITGAKLYPGSWSDWITDDARPVTK